MKSILIKWWQKSLFERLVMVLPCIACLGVMPFVEEKVPMQWNLRGEVTWYASPWWGVPLLPVTILVMSVLLGWFEEQDTNRYRDGVLSAHGKATRHTGYAVMGVLAILSFMQMAWALGYRPDMNRGVVALVALLVAFIGNLMGKLKPNAYVGFRIPWTLASESVWRRTHRVAGWLWTTSGLAMAWGCWFLPESVLRPSWASVWLGVMILPPQWVAWNAARPRSGSGAH